VVWNFPDPIPQHREPLYGTGPTWWPSTRRTTTRRRSGACPPCSSPAGQERRDNLHEKFPLIMTSGRLVEYEGGGEETRSNPWLAELQQEMFVEINPKAPADRGIRNGEYVWVKTPRPAARLKGAGPGDRARGPDTVFLPFHFSAAGRARTCWPYYPRARAGGARRGGQHRHHLRLRQRDDDAGNQDDVCQIEKA
jgi:formate dehydrogenase major subunit